MTWNWEMPDWPNFKFDDRAMGSIEAKFLLQGGTLAGSFRHLLPAENTEAIVEILASEGVSTSAIEGEVLEQSSVRSSILQNLGVAVEAGRPDPKESTVAALVGEVLRNALKPLTEYMIMDWHRLLFADRAEPIRIGAYRTNYQPMQIVSGQIGDPKVFFEAPPSSRVQREMDEFFDWFAMTEAAPAVTRSAIAHLRFESIHPFEDGNGRIGRAISEKALAQGIGAAIPTLLSTEIVNRRKEYYSELESASRNMDITRWLQWFGDVVLTGQERTQRWIDFVVDKSRLLDKLRGRMNTRQEKAILWLLREGPEGLRGGLSSGNYQGITGAPSATATRDLAELVALGALRKTGAGKGTRYWLSIVNPSDSPVR